MHSDWGQARHDDARELPCLMGLQSRHKPQFNQYVGKHFEMMVQEILEVMNERELLIGRQYLRVLGELDRDMMNEIEERLRIALGL